MNKKQLLKKASNNWETYIDLAKWVAMDSPTKYEVIPYKSYKGIKKIKLAGEKCLYLK